MTDFPLDAYLARIGLTDVPKGSKALATLVEAHMRHIPFENIDPLTGKVPSLALEDLVAKLIHGGRGGYCFEHSTLLGVALQAMGFQARPILGRVRNGEPRGGARTHLAIMVRRGNDGLICDVGFGGLAPLGPVPMDPMGRDLPNGSYRVVSDFHTNEWVLERKGPDHWVGLWGFDDIPLQPEDFEAGNLVAATWDKAPFKANLMMAFNGVEGRLAMFNRALTRGLPEAAEKSIVADRDALDGILRGEAGLTLSDGEVDAVWARIKDAPTSR